MHYAGFHLLIKFNFHLFLFVLKLAHKHSYVLTCMQIFDISVKFTKVYEIISYNYTIFDCAKCDFFFVCISHSDTLATSANYL